MRTTGTVLLAVGVLVLAAFAWWLFPSDARRVRARLDALAGAVSIPASEPDLARLARARRFASMLAGDVEVSFQQGASVSSLTGKDPLVALVARPAELAGGMKVQLRDVTVQVASDGTRATSSALARLTYSNPQTHEPSVEEHAITVEWRKIDGAWLVTAARVGAAY